MTLESTVATRLGKRSEVRSQTSALRPPPSARWFWTILAAVLGSAPTAFAAAANADGSPGGTPSSKSVATTNAAALVTPRPESVFVVAKSRAEGVDPFFPLSRRLDVVETSSSTNRPSAAGDLVIKGLSGTAAAPLIIINDRTFGVGDEKDVVTTEGRARVRCLEIHLKEAYAIVEANGERRELRFRSGK